MDDTRPPSSALKLPNPQVHLGTDQEGRVMKVIVLLSGGIDSCVVLAHALSQGHSCTALSFHYGQRHVCELESAAKIAAYYGVDHRTIRIDPSLFSGPASSSLTNPHLTVDTEQNAHHPNTYVPCRNLLFLSHAASLAEAQGVGAIYFGANANDGPSYPDCRPAFFQAFETAVEHGSYVGHNGLNLETAVGPRQKVQDFESESLTLGVEHSQKVKATPIVSDYGSKDCAFCEESTAVSRLKIVCPLIDLDKASIVALGRKLNAPLDLTWSCYDPHHEKPCTVCTACTLRTSALSIKTPHKEDFAKLAIAICEVQSEG